MFLKIRIYEEEFSLSIGNGYNDWVWLAHYASKVYSKTIYPQGVYLPTILYLEDTHKQQQMEFHPHPRYKIFKYLEAYAIEPQELICVIKVRKPNHIYNEMYRKWYRQAYEKEQHLITFNFTYIVANLNRKKDFLFKVKTTYTMAEYAKHLFNEKDYPTEIRTLLQDKQIGPNYSRFVGSLQLPLGTATHRLLYLYRYAGFDEYTETYLNEKKIKKEDFIIRYYPIHVPRHYILSLIEKDMKIDEDISKTLQYKYLYTKKRNASSSLCCFTFYQLWYVIETYYAEEINLPDYERSTVERIKLLIEKNLDRLYEIFFYYFVIENQQRDKKEELGVTYQEVMHFLRDYGVFQDLQTLTDFFEFYNCNEDKYRRIEDTLDITNHSIKFPQFVVILLRSIQFLQSSITNMKGETFDSAADKIFTNIAYCHSYNSYLTPFHLNLCENPKIISSIRMNSYKLKHIYVWMFKSSIESASEICIGKYEIKLLLITFNLVNNGSNIDKLTDECWKELQLSKKYIFYYDYLIIFQWLAMALIKYYKYEEDEELNEDEETNLIIEKIKFFISKINPN